MKIRPIAIAGISVFLISPAIAADPTEKNTAPEATAITNQAAEYVKAYNAGDPKAFAQYFTDVLCVKVRPEGERSGSLPIYK